MVTVYVLRGHRLSAIGNVLSALDSYLIDEDIAETEWDGEEGDHDSFETVGAIRLSDFGENQTSISWEEIGRKLVARLSSGGSPVYFVYGINIGSPEFVQFIKKITKPFGATVIDVVVRGDPAFKYATPEGLKEFNKFNKTLI